MNSLSRKSLIKSSNWLLGLPLLSATSSEQKSIGPKRMVIVGNPFGMHPESFFPQDFGKNYTPSRELKTFEWIRDRLSIFSHTDHAMESGHQKEVSFLSGILPKDASLYPDGCVSIDQVIGERFRSETRHSVINVAVGKGIEESWTRNGTPIIPIQGAKNLYNKLFLNLNQEAKTKQLNLWDLNKQMLNALNLQYKQSKTYVGKDDLERLDQYRDSIHNLTKEIESQESWFHKEKPSFKMGKVGSGMTSQYNNIFDMILFALQTDQTRVATISFGRDFDVKSLGLTKSYHSYTHNGKVHDSLEGLVAIENFQLEQVSRFMKKLDAIPEPQSNGSMLDHTLVMFGSGMGYAGTHINRDLPILLFGGNLKHQGHVSLKKKNQANTPLCNLYLSILNKFGFEQDYFNVSNGTVTI